MKRVLLITLFVLLLAYLGSTLFFAQREHAVVECRGVKVMVNEPELNSLIDTLTVSRLLVNKFGHFEGRLINSIDVDTIVSYLNTIESIKEAGVYFSQNGFMYVNVKQHEPLFRVFPDGGVPYAIDEMGQVMPLRGSAAFRSIVVSGHLTKGMAMNEVKDLVEYINDNELWRAMFEQIYIDASGDYILVPNIANFKIRLGDLTNLDLKFDNLKLYLEQGVEQRGWNIYKEINLKFTNQVIGVKR